MSEVARKRKAGNWTEAARRILKERYLGRTSTGELETPEEMCWRVANDIGQAEWLHTKDEDVVRARIEQFYDLMVDGKFLPNSPTLMNAGKGNGLQYSACYVLPVGDSMEDIFEAIKRAALIHQSGGGTGFAFSRLRRKDSVVKSTGGRASGPVSFLRVFNSATEAVKQGGTRRGANMGILRVDHPDVLEFVHCKLDGGITNFNISIAVTDRFMNALASDTEYDLIDPHAKEVTGRLRARDVFRAIVDCAWRTGDPGLIFIDRINHSPANPTPEIWDVEATNPCGEQPLAPNEACNLGSVNLGRFAVRGSDGAMAIDWGDLERVCRLSVRFLDDVIERNPYPLPDIDHTVKLNRRIGLGVMGWADLLFELAIPYASDEALALGDQVMSFIKRVSHDEDTRLAEERGPFPNWPKSIYRDGRPMRNSTVTTIAPTGTISLIAGCSSGIEPVFAIAYSHIVGDRHLKIANQVFERVAKERGFYTPELMERVAETGHAIGLAGVPDDIQKVFVTAHDVPFEWHVRHQGAFQKHTDNGVSKTINLSNHATTDDVARAYLLAWEQGCLGITVFRDGCKGTQVLHVGARPKEGMKGAQSSADAPEVGVASAAPLLEPVVAVPPSYEGAGLEVEPRPVKLHGTTYRIGTPLGTAFITVNHDAKGEPFEVFANVGKAGSDIASVAEALGRLVSLSLRLPSPLPPRERLREIAGQLAGIGGGQHLGFGKDRVRSLPDAMARVLKDHLSGQTTLEETPGIVEEAMQEVAVPAARVGDICPDCGQASFVFEEGCQKCYVCGNSKC